MGAPTEVAAGAAGRAFYAWALGLGVLLFGSAWAWHGGWWARLLASDPSGISTGIIALTLVVTLWCGVRTRRLGRECAPGSPWRSAYRHSHARGAEQAAQHLGDLTHGPHETAWWFASTTIKLGLLGTVVGFIVMIGQLDLQGTDTAQIQALLAQMTKGMGIALVTTLVGLCANLLLGIQLLLLDRLADRVAGAILDAEAIRA